MILKMKVLIHENDLGELKSLCETSFYCYVLVHERKNESGFFVIPIWSWIDNRFTVSCDKIIWKWSTAYSQL